MENLEKECNCNKTVAESIQKHFTEKNAKTNGFTIISGEWEHESIFPNVQLYSNFIIKSTFTKKDGSTSKPVNHHASIFYTFCPFCGKKFHKSN